MSKPTALVFGYGSLLDPESIARTLPAFAGRGYALLPAAVRGWKRTWTAVLPNWDATPRGGGAPPDSIAYMNVEPGEDAEALGIVFPVTEEELEALRERESIYTPVEITDRVVYLRREPPRGLHALPVLTFTAAHPWRSGGNWGVVGVRADYRALIRRASRALDSAWSLDGRLERDFEVVNGAFGDFADVTPPPDGRYAKASG